MAYINHPNHPNKQYFIDNYALANLMALKKRIAKDSDVVAAFVGSPGDGKDTIAQQFGYALDPNLSIESIKWSYEDYVKYSLWLFHGGKSKGRVVIHSEGRESLSGLAMTSKRTRSFMNFLYENRQMDMYQFILTGDFFDLPKSIVMQRLMFMVYVHEEGEFEKGYFSFFNRKDLKNLYIFGKPTRNMRAIAPSFRGRFMRFYTVGDDEYRRRKSDYLTEDRYIEKEKNKELSIKDVLYWIWDRNEEPKPSAIIEQLRIDHSTYFKYRKEAELDSGLNI